MIPNFCLCFMLMAILCLLPKSFRENYDFEDLVDLIDIITFWIWENILQVRLEKEPLYPPQDRKDGDVEESGFSSRPLMYGPIDRTSASSQPIAQSNTTRKTSESIRSAALAANTDEAGRSAAHAA